MASVVTCSDCGAKYPRSRGRPPKVPLCSPCTNARWSRSESGLLEGKIKVTKSSADLGERPSVREPMRGLVAREQVEWLLPEDTGPTLHGATGQAVTNPCPSCGYAYADGGYCQDCGWAKEIKRYPYGTLSGKRA